MDDKKIILAKKLKALADRGVDGERLNAQEKLKEFLAKHKMSLEDIEDDVPKLRNFDVKPEQRKFFRQVASSVLGGNFQTYTDKTNPNTMLLKVTNSDFCEIEIKFNFHWHYFWEDVQVFYKAYINKNNLTIKGSYIHRNYSAQEEEEIKKMWQFAEYMPSRNAPNSNGQQQPLKRLD